MGANNYRKSVFASLIIKRFPINQERTSAKHFSITETALYLKEAKCLRQRMKFPKNSSLQCFRTAPLSMVTANTESRNPMDFLYVENQSKNVRRQWVNKVSAPLQFPDINMCFSPFSQILLRSLSNFLLHSRGLF